MAVDDVPRHDDVHISREQRGAISWARCLGLREPALDHAAAQAVIESQALVRA